MNTPAAVRELAVTTDAQLAALDVDYHAMRDRIERLLVSVHDATGERAVYIAKRRCFTTPDADAVAELRRRLDAGEVDPWDVERCERHLAELATVQAAADANRDAADVLEAVHTAHGWTRYLTVRDGHIHRDHSAWSCSRTVTTQHGWNAELSGLDEEAAVTALGPSLCTHCFPDAPISWTQGPAKPARCAGTGRYVTDARRRGMRSWGACPECGHHAQLTPNGKVRAHKPAPQPANA